MNLLLSFLIVLAIIIGLQTVGVILMSAMLIAPAVAARQWVNRLWSMVTLAATSGAISGVGGTLISSLSPGIPTGPVIVVLISVIAIFSFLFAPEQGIVYSVFRYRKNKIKLKIKRKVRYHDTHV